MGALVLWYCTTSNCVELESRVIGTPPGGSKADSYAAAPATASVSAMSRKGWGGKGTVAGLTRRNRVKLVRTMGYDVSSERGWAEEVGVR